MTEQNPYRQIVRLDPAEMEQRVREDWEQSFWWQPG